MPDNFIGFAVARRTARANLVDGWLDGATLGIYDGTRPADADTAITTQTLLAEFTLPNPAGSVTDGVFTGDAITEVTVSNTGTAAWARAIDSADAVIADLEVGTTGSGSAIEINSVSLVTGSDIGITSFVITEV